MAGNERYAMLDDFSGGENTLMPPDAIGKNEAAKLTNLVPGLDGHPLKVRGGTQVTMFVGDGPIRGMYRFTRSDSSHGLPGLDIVASGSQVFYVDEI